MVKKEKGVPENPLLNKESEDKQLRVHLVFPKAAMRSLDLKGEWTGKVSARVTGPTSSRLGKIARMAEAVTVRRRYIPSRDVAWLIREWDRRVEPPPYDPGERNRQFKKHRIEPCRMELETLVAEFDRESLTTLLERYFRACARNDHIWKDIDHRYKTLSGWVKALLKSTTAGQYCWWDKKEAPLAGTRRDAGAYRKSRDPFPKTTKMVADSYARLVLGNKEYEKTGAYWRKFQAAAERVEYCMKEGEIPAERIVFINAIVSCAVRQAAEFNNRTIYPGHLVSDMLWRIALPQFLEENLPGTRLPENLFGGK